ncbi:tetratricopeptide repeat protein [Sphingomonas sp. HITSZ_GF]|uniref:tetratricopeptide repeat protein n=1 Tax=Sphingomonas sp. HITSZ_GF TaxID=3037247 RepID=UPI00240D6FA2|nr:tetratricopeptide repeat protein [Sphingomonas sp. HITSZ_GF]MDG2535528.1 tetratricopeptide repeat protein [Sphingomonas sp. HITSZ_GF]
MTQLDQLSSEEIAARLSGSPEERAALLREAAEAGLAEAQAVYGQMLLDAQNPGEAFGWFWKAARQGHPMALNMLGRCYDLGWGTRIDKVRAAECFRVAAEAGLDWGMYNYGSALALGAGLTRDKAAALGWFQKAAAMGHAKSRNFLGSFYEDGELLARDMDAAAACYAQAAEGGDFRGMFNHARMLAQAGDIEGALLWIGRCGEAATAPFRDKALAWLAQVPDMRLRAEGSALLRKEK